MIIAIYIASVLVGALGLFMDYSTSVKFYKPNAATGGVVSTKEGNKFWRKKDGTFNSTKYLLVLVVPIIALNGVGVICNYLMAPMIFNFIVGPVFLLQGLENKHKMNLPG